MPQMISPFTHTCRALHGCAVTMLLSLAALRGAAAQASAATDAPSDMSRMIGLSVAASGGPRDTLGLLIATVTRDGPADRAGITTGSRILAVNGLQVRLAPADIGRRAAADSALLKFDRALRVTPPGRDVMLRVAGGGLTRLVNVPVADRRTSALRASVAVRVPESPVATGAPTPSDTNGERGTGAPPASASPPVTIPVLSTRPAAAIDPVAVASVPASPTASVATAAQLPREPQSVSTIADALGEMQLEVRRLARDSRSLAMSDSLAELDAAMGVLRRRMRAMASDAVPASARVDSVASRVPMAAANSAPVAVAPVSSTPAAPSTVAAAKTPGMAATTRIAVSGLELARVSGELAAYLGAQADSALSVIRASDAWEPMRAGDVIVRVDGAAPDQERLRSALEAHRRVSVTLLRRGRAFTVLLGEPDAR